MRLLKYQETHEWLCGPKMGVEFRLSKDTSLTTDMAMSAAEAGVGIAMARSMLLKWLETGKLISPFKPIPANAGTDHLLNETTATFTQWLKEQV